MLQTQTSPWMIERVLRRERLVMAAGLAAAIALAWAYLVREAGRLSMSTAMDMAGMHPWGAAEWLGLFVTWTVMMAAMMLPSAAPVILIVLAMYRRRDARAARVAAVAFIGGYLLAWTGFSLAASFAELSLHQMARMASDVRLTSSTAAGSLLLAAGIYQWLPIKNRCLTHCRSPLGFLSRHWREGTLGGLTMGVRHGMYCVGCCAFLMALLFVVGVMSLAWIAALTAFVLVEKLVRGGMLAGRVAGAAAACWGLYLLVV